MIGVLSENRVRPNVPRSERYESDSGREQPRDEPKKSANNHQSVSIGSPSRGVLRLDFKNMLPPLRDNGNVNNRPLQQVFFVHRA
ncbi:hypothetical protein FBZ94_1011059 [Bradyrhizobium sacchari]|uniref:Uncharacterized protein n=1 Tax=Bradyrhizobium sacchari TaxID=1399419 RepID=A0A560KRC4_9BRAD|nr:hypothetical protein FBZ94_1011059 [Bradyrhizobium sacchari]TWB84614.1 hypothetical protein FBZ95_1011059 [Bradyrhizobium sacchari]